MGGTCELLGILHSAGVRIFIRNFMKNYVIFELFTFGVLTLACFNSIILKRARIAVHKSENPEEFLNAEFNH